MVKIIYTLTKWYYSAEVKGLENIPNSPCLLVGNHNAIAVVNPEIWIFGSHYLQHHHQLKVLGHDLVLKIPGIAFLAKKYLHYIPNNFESSKNALQEGAHLLVYPGGGWESSRPSEQRDQIDFKNRTGFIQLAKESHVPIIPIVSTGAHDGLYIIKRGHRIAKWLGLQRLLRIDTFPLGFSFPFVFHIGPFFPFIPLRSKVVVEILPAIHSADLPGDDAEAAQHVVRVMQNTLTKNLNLLPRTRPK